MYVIYRISNNSYNKTKLPCCDKFVCLENFVNAFSKIDLVIADNCSQDTIKYIIDKNFNFHTTNLGNAGSFLYALEKASCLPDDEIVYFVEDDYLHNTQKSNLEVVIEQGLSFGDYVTLYDHPDKYGPNYDYGEISKVRYFKKLHWRSTISTTMTFATKAKTIKEDKHIFDEICRDKFHPNDHQIFLELDKKHRKLYVCIPGLAIHTDIASNLELDFFSSIEPWVYNILESMMKNKIRNKSKNDLSFLENLDVVKKLLILEQMALQIL